MTCLAIAIGKNKIGTLATLLGGDAPSAAGTGWTYGDLVAAYWQAIEANQHQSVELLV